MSSTPTTLRVFGPPRTGEVVDAMRAMLAPDVGYRLAHHADLTWEPQLDVVEVEPGVVLEKAGSASSRGAPTTGPSSRRVGYPSRARRPGGRARRATRSRAPGSTSCAATPTSTCRRCSDDDLVRMVPVPRFQRHDRLPLDAWCRRRETARTRAVSHARAHAPDPDARARLGRRVDRDRTRALRGRDRVR